MGRDVKRIDYEYRGKPEHFNLVICDNQIATICKDIETPDGTFDIEVVSEGMSYEEIVENFPSLPSLKAQGYEYCLADLIHAIIYEEFLRGAKELGNVRNFWYTHLKFIIEDILKLGETPSVKTAINNAWADLINSGTVTYEDMSIFSAKENVRHSVIRDSPFANMIVAAEKEDLFEWFKWIPQLFNCTLITAGGQPSRAVARAFIRELKETSVDLDQKFYMCTISDLDPAGYYIQDAFAAQFEKAIEFYGGSGTIEIRRLFVRKDQITPTLLQYQAMKCEDVGAKKAKAKKAEDTKWAYFCRVTDGGLYKEEDGVRYRAKLELEAFGKGAIEKRIIVELLKIIEETNDESLIMIPEIMRIFGLQRIEAIAEILKKHKDDWLQPQMDDFLTGADDLKRKLSGHTWKEKADARGEYEKVTDPIREKYEGYRERMNANIDNRVEAEESEIQEYRDDQGFTETLDMIDNIREILSQLETTIDNEVREACEENYDEIERVNKLRDKAEDDIDKRKEGALKPHEEEYEKAKEDIKQRDTYRKEELEKYRREKETLFNPVEKELERRIKEAMSPEELDYWYRNLEEDDRTRPHISLLMMIPDTLLEDDVSAWEQDSPVFKEQDLLQKASKAKDENVEPHRRGFTPDFLVAMKSILLERGKDIEIEYPEVPEFEDIDKELQELHDEIEKGIEEEEYKSEEDDEDELDGESD